MSHMLRRLVLPAVIAALAVPAVPLFAAPAPAGQAAAGTLSGSARGASGETMPNTTVRLRDARTGELAGSTTTGADGQFTFAALNPGTYVVEVVNGVGEVVGTSAAVSLATGAMTATAVTVTASAAQFAAAGGGSFFASTLGAVTIAAIGAGIVGVIVVANRDDASPSN